MKPLEIKYEEPKLETIQPYVRVETIFGKAHQVTSIPTWKPKTFIDGLAFDTTSSKVYYYDFTNLVWKSVGGSSGYGGYVDAAATAEVVPTGWSAAYDGGTKIYTVTHNLGTTSYALVCVAMGVGAETSPIPLQQARNANTFQVQFSSLIGASGATEFNFILTPIS